MKQYTITPVTGTPDWSQIPAVKVDHQNWLEPVDISMTAQVCYDENGLYVHLRAWEQEIRAEHAQPLSMVCEDSCMEFFFRPEETDPRYFNIEMNPLGYTYIGLAYDRWQACRLTPMDEEAQMQKTCRRLEDGWEVFYTVPVRFIQVFFPGYALTRGKKLYGNFYKCGDLTSRPHYLSWSPMTCTQPEFHRTCDFGELLLG